MPQPRRNGDRRLFALPESVIHHNLLPRSLMSIERRPGTLRTYVTKVQRVDGRLQKRYIGSSADPTIHLFSAEHQLGLADQRARRKKHKDEIERDRTLEATFGRLDSLSKNWKIIHRLTRLPLPAPQPIDMKKRKAKLASSKLPTPSQFSETCRLANGGDQAAKRQLDRWISRIPGHLSKATDLLAIAESQLVDFLSHGSQETEALIRRKIAKTSSDLQSLVPGDPLANLHADALTLAWMDLMRCQLGAMRPFEDAKNATYWDAAADRTSRRWDRLEKAFGRYRKEWLKQSKKR